MNILSRASLCLGLALVLHVSAPLQSRAAIVISEYMYSGANGEFIEFTNIGLSSVDFTGWSYDDDSRTPGSFDLSAFGLVASGESVVLAEIAAGDFRTAWSLSASVKVIGGLTVNLGRNDEINLFNASGDLIDRLTFGDQNIPGSIRTQNVSGTLINDSFAGTNDISGWQLSAIADANGSYASAGGDIGSPGISNLTAVPEPSSFAVIALATGGFAGLRRFRQNRVLPK
jgi:predicted extracellular nuclease